MDSAFVVEMDGKKALQRCVQHLQDCCCSKRRIVPENLLEFFALVIKLVDHLVASAPEAFRYDADYAAVAMANVLKKTHGEADNAGVVFSKRAKVQGRE